MALSSDISQYYVLGDLGLTEVITKKNNKPIYIVENYVFYNQYLYIINYITLHIDEELNHLII